MKSLKKIGIVMVLFIVLSLTSCGNNDSDSTSKKFGIFTVNSDGTSANVEGVIVDKTLDDFDNMILQYPDIKTLNLVDVPGADVSGDLQTDTSLELGRRVYQLNINTHLVDDGFVASGGTDLLVSGKSVTVGSNPTIGVHSWGGGFEGNPSGSAWDIKDDENHVEHQKYVRFYEDVGFAAQDAKDFYFFTIRAAEPDDIHNMTPYEINKYIIKG